MTLTERQMIEKARNLRDHLVCDGELEVWTRIKEQEKRYELLARLVEARNPCCSFLKSEDFTTLRVGIDQITIDRLEALSGQHGYVIFKMLEAKMADRI